MPRKCLFFRSIVLFWVLALSSAASRRADAQGIDGYVHRFPDFNVDFKPTEQQFDGALFRLSQDYPLERPQIDRPLGAILSFPYDQNATEENWRKYLMMVRAYCFDGNLEVQWRGQENRKRKWYHVPWQHAGEKGREGINGLTREATAAPMQLAATQTKRHQTHAVAMYNDLGGYTIGKVWKVQFEPNPSAAVFPVGSVVAKILFTAADETDVPYLKNPIVWKAYVGTAAEPSKRQVRELRLIQMDVMIRDDRANGTGGWLFGTFCYNGQLNNANRWENLVPVGLQWGNDPTVVAPADNPENEHPTKTQINSKLKQSVINPLPELPPQHLGWGGRLNGPVDYFRSSCLSCHSTAQFPGVAPQHPDFDSALGYKPGGREWNEWFRNLGCGQSFSPILNDKNRRAISTDFSLQLAIGIDNFYRWKSMVMGGYFTPVLPEAPDPKERIKVYAPSSEAPEHPWN